MQRLKQSVTDLKGQDGSGETQLSERDQLINKQYEADKEKLHKIRLLLVRKVFFTCPRYLEMGFMESVYERKAPVSYQGGVSQRFKCT